MLFTHYVADFSIKLIIVTSYCRYLFKSLDPEFGTVKEELTEDSDKLPGWEGKVIGWIEDDLS